MANEFQNKVIAVLIFIFGLSLFYVLTFLVHFPDVMGGLFSDNLTKGAFWIGYVLFMITILFVKPWILIANSEKDANLTGVGQATVMFLASCFGCYIIYNMLDSLFSMPFFSTMLIINQIMSLGFLIFTILGMDIIPIYLMVRD